MGYEELVDTEICASRDDVRLRIEDDYGAVKMTIEQAERLRDWLNRVLPSNGTG